MPRNYKKRPTLKTEQLVLRLTKETIGQLKDIVASQAYPTTRVGVIESLIAGAHANLKGSGNERRK